MKSNAKIIILLISMYGICLICLNEYLRRIKYYTVEIEENLKVAEKVVRYKNSSLAYKLNKEVRVLCCLYTTPKNHKTKAIHAKRTWGKRCNKFIIFSSAKDSDLETIALPVGETKDELWNKTRELFKYVYENHMDDADWFLKADDDSFVVLENLRFMLYPYSPNQPIYFGLKLKNIFPQGYIQGGAYVLSKEAVIRLVEKGIPSTKICSPGSHGGEDILMARCFEKLSVKSGDSRDKKGRSRFFIDLPEFQFDSIKRRWLRRYFYYKSEGKLRKDCCSDTAISFHHLLPQQMYLLEYLIYTLKPYGVTMHRESLPPKIPWPPNNK